MVAPTTVPGIHQWGLHSARPTAPLVAAGAIYFCTTHGLIYESDGSVWNTVFTAGGVSGSAAGLGILIDGGGATITTGVKGDLEVPFACTISAGSLLADQTGSIAISVWKDSYANYPPVIGDVISASAPLTISSGVKAKDSTLTGWSKTLAAGDTLRFNVDSVTTIQRVTLTLTVARS